MAKHAEKLSKDEVRKIFFQLCLAISKLNSVEKSAEFLRDLLSIQEAEMIAKRLKIAELLLDDLSYEDIRKKLKVSPGTIARVQEWLKISADTIFSGTLEVDGLLRLGKFEEAPECDRDNEGGTYYNEKEKHFYGCNGTDWLQLDELPPAKVE